MSCDGRAEARAAAGEQVASPGGAGCVDVQALRRLAALAVQARRELVVQPPMREFMGL